jgi:hypothetical protein
MGFLDKLFGKPKAEVITKEESKLDQQARKREAEIIKMHGLKKDPTTPNRYFIDEDNAITFNPRDPLSVANANILLEEYERKPKISRTTAEQKKRYPPEQPAARKKSVMDKMMSGLDNIDTSKAEKAFNGFNELDINMDNLDFSGGGKRPTRKGTKKIKE